MGRGFGAAKISGAPQRLQVGLHLQSALLTSTPCWRRSGTDFATIWDTFCDAIFCASLSRSCAFCAHFLRILCIFGALGQMQWMHRPADRASRPGVAKYRNAAFVVHFTCIYVHLRTRMQNACRMHVNLHKMALSPRDGHKCTQNAFGMRKNVMEYKMQECRKDAHETLI